MFKQKNKSKRQTPLKLPLKNWLFYKKLISLIKLNQEPNHFAYWKSYSNRQEMFPQFKDKNVDWECFHIKNNLRNL